VSELFEEAGLPDHRHVGHHLAGLSGVDLAKAAPATVKIWEARGLALLAMARGDKAEAERVMANINSRRKRGRKTGAVKAPREQQ